MAHPWSSDVFPQSGMKGVTAKRREERKEAKYSKLYSSTGEKSSVVPLVFEHFGRWGEKAETYLSSLASRSRDEAGRKNASDFKCYWRRRIAVRIQKCNGKVIARKISKLSRNDTFDSPLAISKYLYGRLDTDYLIQT